MEPIRFAQQIQESGQVVIPRVLLEKMQYLGLTPENLGYLVLGIAKSQENPAPEDAVRDLHLKWCLREGWASWEGTGDTRRVTFQPLWRRLYDNWSAEAQKEKRPEQDRTQVDFQYSKIIKWLDQVRGTLSVTIREKQVIQEFNLKYGWSTDFILIFLQLVFERGHNQVNTYQPIAKRIYENGIDTVDSLVAFINELDWVLYKVSEIKKCIGQYGGGTRPQREMYLKWNREWRFGHELILRAADETVRTNSPSFKYIDGILKNWYDKGVQTIEQAEKALKEHDERIKPAPSAQKGDPRRNNRPDNRDWEKILGIE